MWIETYVDKIRQRANLTEAIKPGMIHVEDVYKRQALSREIQDVSTG